MKRWVRFLTIDDEALDVDRDAFVRTLAGEPRLAGDVSDQETVRVTVLRGKRQRPTEVQAMRDRADFREARRRCDGSTLPDRDAPVYADRVAPARVEPATPSAAPEPPAARRAVQRGWVEVWTGGGKLALRFAPWVEARVRNVHRSAALGLVELDLAERGVEVAVSGDQAIVPAAVLADALSIAVTYLTEHGFEVRRTA